MVKFEETKSPKGNDREIKSLAQLNEVLWTIMGESVKTGNMAIIKDTLKKIRALNLKLIETLDIQSFEVNGWFDLAKSEAARAERLERDLMKAILKKGKNSPEFQEYLKIADKYIQTKP